MQNATPRRVWWTLLLLALVIAGCDRAPARESAAPVWSLSAEPTLMIGSDSVPETTFGGIAGVVGLGDGRIAVLDPRATEVRLFDSAGAYLRTIARPGRGPGEFTAIDWIQEHGDSILVHDIIQRRAAVLGTDGTVHRTVVPAPDSTIPWLYLAARLRGGVWVANVPQAGQRQPGLSHDSLRYGLLSPAASGVFQPLVVVAGTVLVRTPLGTTPARFHIGDIVTPLGDRLAVIDPDSGTVRLFSRTGSEPAGFPVPIPRIPLTPEMTAASLARETANAPVPEMRLAWEAFDAAEPKPAVLPMFRAALADGDAALWLEEFELDPLAPRRYRS